VSTSLRCSRIVYASRALIASSILAEEVALSAVDEAVHLSRPVRQTRTKGITSIPVEAQEEEEEG
jgi:hypothetical protein